MLIISHSACLDHDNGAQSPERPERLQAILRALKGSDFVSDQYREAPLATRTALERIHLPQHIDAVLASRRETLVLDWDTVASPGSAEAAARAAGGVIDAVDSIFAKRARCAFVATRPPGHHAEPDRAMGFCLLNNVALGAAQACVHGARRIAVVDFDVHHGNGTESCFLGMPAAYLYSSHQVPLYPGTGLEHTEASFNIPLPPGTASHEFRAAWTGALQHLAKQKPDFVLFSAGFDAHARDPLGELELADEDFRWITEAVIDATSDGLLGVVSVLEGGYDLEALQSGMRAHLQGLRKFETRVV